MLIQRHKKHIWKFAAVFSVLIYLLVFSAGVYGEEVSGLSWPKITKQNKPWTYWWWMGSAVDKKGLTEHLEKYHKAGIGGVHIIPIYGAKGYESRFIEYLSPQWMEMLGYTVKEANRLGMGVDMTTGTGWPFGGPNVSAEDATAKVIFRTYTLEDGAGLEKPLRADDKTRRKAEHLQALVAYSDSGAVVDLTGKVDADGNPHWVAPEGKWRLYAVFEVLGGKKVERAAPGGAGYVLDPFSSAGLKKYLRRFDNAFAEYGDELPRAQ